MIKVAFYLMTSKGLYVLKNFITKFGPTNIEYVVCSRDAKVKKDFYHEIKNLCEKEKIEFFDRSEEFVNKIEKNFSGYKFAIGWRWIIENSSKLIVLHDSLLPRYRGFAPLVNSLINGEKLIGVTALLANFEYDKGDIINQKSCEINYPIKISEAIELIEPLYFELVQEIFITLLHDKIILPVKQNEKLATYSIWLDEKDYFINWNWSADKIKRFVDATGFPYENAKAYLEDKVVKILDVEIIEDVSIEDRERHVGKIIFMENKIPTVICGSGLLKLLDIRDLDDNNVSPKFRSRFK